MAVHARPGPDGETLYVATEETERGNKAPFHVVYRDEGRERRWGFFCANCETFDNAVDSMGRVQCNECANLKRADEWDAAHE